VPRGRQREWVLGLAYGPSARLLARRHRGSAYRGSACSASTCSRRLRRRDLLGGVHARPPHRRHRARRDGNLLMAGISAFTVPTVEFGPTVLAMPASPRSRLAVGYWALADNRPGRLDRIRHRARTVAADDIRGPDPACADDAVRRHDRARAQPASVRSGRGAPRSIVVLDSIFPHLFWLERTGTSPLPMLAALPGPDRVAEKRLMAVGRTSFCCWPFAMPGSSC